MAEIRIFNPDGSLQRLITDNRDKELTLQLEDLSRQIPVEAASIAYQEFDNLAVETFSISKTREQLLNLIDTFSFVYDYTYYVTSEIDTIRTRVFDAADPPIKLDDTTLKHYLDGRQPEFI